MYDTRSEYIVNVCTCAYVEYLSSYVGIGIYIPSVCADGRSILMRSLASVQRTLGLPCGICIVSWALALAPKLLYDVS